MVSGDGETSGQIVVPGFVLFGADDMHNIIAHTSFQKPEESNIVIVALITPLLTIIFSIFLFIGTGQFTVTGEEPLEYFVVSYIPALVLHLLQLLVSNIDSEYFVVPCELYGVDIAPLRSASDTFQSFAFVIM